MKRTILAAALLGLLSACTTVSWINDVSVAPDGKSVTVVGAEWRVGFVQEISRPVRWNCLRAADGKLSCTADATTLPRME